MLHHGISTLAYRIRLRVVAKYLGQLCGLLAILNLAPVVVALGYGEYAQGWRYLTAVAVLAVPVALTLRLPKPASLQTNEALAITVLAFVLGALAMVYPFMGVGLSWVDALFEAVSGITTTGLSTLTTVEGQPRSFLFARAWLQWYGGLGIVVLSLALLLGPGTVARRLAAAGGDVNDIIGTSRAYAHRVMAIYLLLTLSGIALVIILGLEPFHAVVQILAAISTGGFSSFNASLGSLQGWGIRLVLLIASLGGAIPLALYYHAWRKGWFRFLRDPELQTLIGAVVLVTMTLWLTLPDSGNLTVLGHAAAMAVSSQTTSGFSTLDVASLAPDSKGVLILSMFLGGGVGSTAGGIKILRLLILLRLLQILILRTALPSHAIVEPRLHGNHLENEEIQRALIIVLLYGMVIFMSWLLFLFYGHDPLNALFEVVSATATVGLSAGITSADLADLLKGVLCLDMLLGRVEILAVLILCYPAT